MLLDVGTAAPIERSQPMIGPLWDKRRHQAAYSIT